MKPIIMRELRDRRISFAAYTLTGVGLLWMYVAIYPSIAKSMKDFEKLFQSYPEGLYKALGLQELTFNTLAKFLAMEQFSFVWPILAISFAMSRAGNMIAGDIERGTIGLSLSLPVSRTRLFVAKYLAALGSLLALALITVLAILPLAAAYDLSIGSGVVLKLAGVSCLFAWAIFAATSFLSALLSERSRVYILMGGALLLMYAANVVASLQSSLAWLRHFSVFNYYNAQSILAHGEVRISSLLVFGGTIVLFTALGIAAFNRRDITN